MNLVMWYLTYLFLIHQLKMAELKSSPCMWEGLNASISITTAGLKQGQKKVSRGRDIQSGKSPEVAGFTGQSSSSIQHAAVGLHNCIGST